MINLVNKELINNYQQKSSDSILVESVSFVQDHLGAVSTVIGSPDTTDLKTMLESANIDGLAFDDACEKLYACINKK